MGKQGKENILGNVHTQQKGAEQLISTKQANGITEPRRYYHGVVKHCGGSLFPHPMLWGIPRAYSTYTLLGHDYSPLPSRLVGLHNE